MISLDTRTAVQKLYFQKKYRMESDNRIPVVNDRKKGGDEHE